MGFRNWVYICIIRLEHISGALSLKVCSLLVYTTVDDIKLKSKGRKYSGLYYDIARQMSPMSVHSRGQAVIVPLYAPV